MASTDEAQALELVAERLRARLPHLDRETIREIVEAAYHEFDGAPIRDFVAILVERSALERVQHRVA